MSARSRSASVSSERSAVGFVVQLGEASRVELVEEAPRLGDPREREVARDRGQRRAQSRPVVNLPHEAGTLSPRAVPSWLWNRLEAILRERIAVLDGSWGVLIQRAGARGGGVPRRPVPRPPARRRRQPGPPQPHPAGRRARHPSRVLRGGRRHRHDEHVHGDARSARPTTSCRTSPRRCRTRARGSHARWRRSRRHRRRLRRAAQRLALALAAVDDPAYRAATFDEVVEAYARADPRAARRRRRPAPHRDRLRHAQREGRDRRRAGRRARAAALALVHRGRPQRPQPLRRRPSRRSGSRSSTRSRSSSASTARSAAAEMRPYVEDLAAIAPTWVACHPNAGPAERARRARRAAGGHEPLPRRVRARRPRQHRRRLLRHDAGARPADRRRGRRAWRRARFPQPTRRRRASAASSRSSSATTRAPISR